MAVDYGGAVADGRVKSGRVCRDERVRVKLLQAAGVGVKFAIHPVAGRMPGHMNVLLAEAGVPYDIIFDMEDINAEFANTDVALVIGANDVVNPAARTDKSSPIYGMPILDADQAHQVYVVKRGQGKGYSGVENLLFFNENCSMVYGDAQAVLTQMVQAVKDLGLNVPVVVRLQGTNAKKARTILSESGVSIIPADSMKDAAEKVVKAAIDS